ncbi:MAG TPA: cupredoxin domain-containing protein [Anaerolineales bacterium]|nr:cupredoxin domain-containing protein [Anaerolineales bacterium]
MKKYVFFLAVVLVAALLSACAQKTPEPVSITIDMTEYVFTPSTIEAKVGQQVTLNLVNKGALEHEIMFGRDVMMMNDRPSGYQHDMFEEAGIEPEVMMMEGMGDIEGDGHEEESHSGFMVLLPKTGDQATLSFTMTKDMVGEWEMSCFELEGVHYQPGMVGKFIVGTKP